MLNYIWMHLIQAVHKEHEPTVIDCLMEAISDIIDLLPEMLSDTQKQEAFKVGRPSLCGSLHIAGSQQCHVCL